MGSPSFHAFRSLVEEYASENDVSMTDVAAALAVMSQSDKEFFLRPDPPKAPPRARASQEGWGEPRAKPAGFGRSDRLPAEGAAVYRVAVGKRHKIGPSAIVGALANEGSLKRSDFGKITIGQDHSLVELPADLPDAVFEALANTRISGKLIDLQPDSGPPIRRTREDRKPYKKSHENRAYPSKAPDQKPYKKKAAGKTETAPGGRKPRHK
jgi:ATP-dependent RNA helicase DeaD